MLRSLFKEVFREHLRKSLWHCSCNSLRISSAIRMKIYYVIPFLFLHFSDFFWQFFLQCLWGFIWHLHRKLLLQFAWKLIRLSLLKPLRHFHWIFFGHYVLWNPKIFLSADFVTLAFFYFLLETYRKLVLKLILLSNQF